MKPTLFFIFLSLISILSLLDSSPTIARENSDLDAFLEKIRLRSLDIRSFSCSFLQEKHLSLFPKPVLFHGELKLVRPDKLRWSFISPVPSALIFNGSNGLRCDDTGKPIHFSTDQDPVMRLVAEQILAWLNSDFTKLDKSHIIKKTAKATLQISPSGQTGGQWQAEVSITFDQNNLHPKQVVIVEPEGDMTKIIFSDYLFNTPIDHSTFTQCR